MARGTLVKITETLGIRYLQYLLKEMQSILVKGYQVRRGGSGRGGFPSLAAAANPERPCCLRPGPRADLHGVPAAVGPQTNAEERRPGLLHEHAHQCKTTTRHRRPSHPAADAP